MSHRVRHPEERIDRWQAGTLENYTMKVEVGYGFSWPPFLLFALSSHSLDWGWTAEEQLRKLLRVFKNSLSHRLIIEMYSLISYNIYNIIIVIIVIQVQWIRYGITFTGEHIILYCVVDAQGKFGNNKLVFFAFETSLNSF